MRAKGVSIGGSSNWVSDSFTLFVVTQSNPNKLNNFAVGLFTSPFIKASDYGTFIFFGCITTLAVLYVFFFVPETKGRTLEEMDEIFGAQGVAAADQALKRSIEREIGLLALLGGDGPAEEVKKEREVGGDEVKTETGAVKK